jgi:hypothetical protein
MANTTWNPSDKSAQVTLSGGNLVATSSAGSIVGVRAVDKQSLGKFYWECTQTSVANTSSGVGFFSPTFNLNLTFISGVPGACGVQHSGQIYNNGVFASINFGTITNGTVICLAIDCTARLIWFRLGAAGNWNNSGTADPATGIGGISNLNLGDGIPVFPAVSFGNSPDQYTANFGGTAFTGTVPSGFTSGFTAGASIPTNALASQISAEHWLTTSPQAQVTQIAAEHWATVTGTGVQAVVTQVALEQWASVAIQAGGPIVTMIG